MDCFIKNSAPRGANSRESAVFRDGSLWRGREWAGVSDWCRSFAKKEFAVDLPVLVRLCLGLVKDSLWGKGRKN